MTTELTELEHDEQAEQPLGIEPDAVQETEGADAVAKTTKKAGAKKASKKATKKAAAPKAPKAQKVAKPRAEKKAAKPRGHVGAGARTTSLPADLPVGNSLALAAENPVTAHGTRYIRIAFSGDRSIMLLPVNLTPADTIAMRDKLVKWLTAHLS